VLVVEERASLLQAVTTSFEQVARQNQQRKSVLHPFGSSLSELLLPFFLSVEIARTPPGQTSEVLLRVAELHRLRRDPLRDISRKSKPPSAWIQGRSTRRSVRCVGARTNVRAVRRELRSHSTRSVGASSHSIKCCAIELHRVSLRLTRHISETNLRGLVVLDVSGYYDTIRESQKCFQNVFSIFIGTQEKAQPMTTRVSDGER
jgi:hypothetical protein